jgi:hypothetical protein
MDMSQLLRALGLQQAYQAYQQNIGEPFAAVVGGAGRGYLGLDKPEYGGLLSDESYKTGQAMGYMPAIGAPAGAFKAAAQAPELFGLLGSVAGTKKIGNLFDMLLFGKGYEFDDAGEIITKPNKTIAFGEPNKFHAVRQSNGNNLNVYVEKDDGFYRANYEVDPGFPKSTGQLSNMYLEAMDVAQKDKSGWMSDSIRSDQTNKLYNRLINAGIPFQRDHVGRFFIENDDLQKINLEKIAEQLEKTYKQKNKN